MPLYFPLGEGLLKVLGDQNYKGTEPPETETPEGANNIALGSFALTNIFTEAGTTAANNVAIGFSAIADATTAQDNIAIGSGVLPTQTAERNVGIGHMALGTGEVIDPSRHVTGGSNVAVGWKALNGLTSGEGNIAAGVNTLGSVQTSADNVAVGFQAAANIEANDVKSDGNVFVGYRAGYQAAEATDCIFIGKNAQPGSSTGGNEATIVIGADTKASAASVAVGASALAETEAGVAVGVSAQSSGLGAVALGALTIASSTNATALGVNSAASFVQSTAVGAGATTTAQNQVMLGTATDEVYFPGKITGKAGFSPIAGDATINNSIGMVTVGAGQSSVEVTSDKFSVSLVLAMALADDATGYVKSTTQSGANKFKINVNPPTNDMPVGFVILNMDLPAP